MSENNTIILPSNIEIDKIENGKIYLKDKKKQLPKTWEEFCYKNNIKVGECYIDRDDKVVVFSRELIRRVDYHKCVYKNKETADAFIALSQLIRVMDCYNDGWVPDWNTNEMKYVIYCNSNHIITNTTIGSSFVLSFKTKELRDEFLKNFRSLIEIAKNLI